MTDRQAFALANPINTTSQDPAPYRRIEPQPDGNLLVSMLAIDR